MLWAKQNTDKTVTFGPVLAADGTMSSGALAYTDARIFKNGTDAALNASATFTHKYEGAYALLLKAGDLDTVGIAEVVLNKNPLSASPVKLCVLTANVYDSLFGNDLLDVSLVQILGTALTETAGLIAGGFKKLFNVATPTGTLNSLPGAVPGAAGGIFIAGTNAATAITTALTSNIIGNVTGNLSGTVCSVTGAIGSVGAGGITAASLASNTITADKIATDAITAAKIAADAISASELAAAAVTKIWDAANFSGVSTGRAVTITLKDTNTSGAVIDSARIEIWANCAVAPMYALTNATNASGQFTPRLADGNYTAVIAKPAVYTFSNQNFTVAAGAVTFEWYGTPVSVSAPPSSVTSTLYGYCVTAAGAAAEGIQISAKSVLTNLHATTKIVTNLASTATTDVNGYFALTVMRNEPLLVTCAAAGLIDYPVAATAATVDLGTLVVASA